MLLNISQISLTKKASRTKTRSIMFLTAARRQRFLASKLLLRPVQCFEFDTPALECYVSHLNGFLPCEVSQEKLNFFLTLLVV